jgi:dihydropyrimidinase
MKTLIRNASVCLEDHIEVTDVLIGGGIIKAIGRQGSATDGTELYDATGLNLLPGFIDIHTHLSDRIGAFDLADTYSTASEIALANGITTLCNFVTQQTGEKLSDALALAKEKYSRSASGSPMCNVGWHLTPTRFEAGDWRDIDECIERGSRTFKFYTTYRHAGIYSSYEQLDTIVGRLAKKNVQFLIHCEDDEIVSSSQAAQSDVRQPISHARMRPPLAEVKAIEKVLAIAAKYDASIHFVHVSTPAGAALVKGAKANGRVTCETAPHYLFLNEDNLRGVDGHHWICSPPLRSEAERLQLSEMAREGVFDLYATDHCAFRKADKDLPFTDIRLVPNGLAGIGALPHMVFKLYEKDVPYALRQMALRLSENPARLIGAFPGRGVIRVGSEADLVLVNPHGDSRPIRSSFADVHETFPGVFSNLEFSQVFRGGIPTKRESIN